jgi:perosamine synthetase
MNHLQAEGIGCNCYFTPIHTQPYIMETLDTKAGDFPITEHIAARTIALPFFAEITPEQIDTVVTALNEAIQNINPS